MSPWANANDDIWIHNNTQTPTWGSGNTLKITVTSNATGSTTYDDRWVQSFANKVKMFQISNNTFKTTGMTTQTMQDFDYIKGEDLPVRRKTPPREFNPYINASDLLEEFIRYAGENGARQGDVLTLPIELFVKWLVIRACEQDDEEPNVTLQLPPRPPQPRCLGCQRYMRRDTKLPLHGRRCAAHLYNREEDADGLGRQHPNRAGGATVARRTSPSRRSASRS